MKKILVLLMALAMSLTISGCKTSQNMLGGNSGSTVQEDPIDRYVGKYLCVKMGSPDADYTEFLQSSWDSRSFYEYAEITEDGTFTLYSVSHGEKETLFEYRFDAETCTLYLKDDRSDAFPLGYENGMLNLTVSDGTPLSFEKNDEIE